MIRPRRATSSTRSAPPSRSASCRWPSGPASRNRPFTSNAARGGADHSRTFRPRPARAAPQAEVQLLVDAHRREHRQADPGLRRRRSRARTRNATAASAPRPRCRRRSGSGTTPAANRRNSTVRASSCSASRCSRRCSLRSPCRRKASRRPFCRSTFPASRPTSSCWERSSPSW